MKAFDLIKSILAYGTVQDIKRVNTVITILTPVGVE